MNLNLIHLNQLCANRFGHCIAITCSARLIGGNIPLKVGAILRNHVGIGAQTACGENNSLGAVVALVGFHAGNRSIVGLHELLDVTICLDFDAAILNGLLQTRNNGLADSRAVGRAMAALHRHAARHRDVVKRDAQAIKPINSSGGVIAHEVDELLIASIVTAIQGFLGKKLIGVLDALSLLEFRFGSVHARRREIRVAADIAFFLKNDDLLNACIMRRDGSRHARSTSTHDNDVVFFGLAFRLATTLAGAARHAKSSHRTNGCRACNKIST